MIVGKDGAPLQWFVDAWNNLVSRTGTEFSNSILGTINGAQQLAEQQRQLAIQQAADRSASVARDQANAGAGDGSGDANSALFGGVSAGAAWVSLGGLTLTPGGAGGDYTVNVTADGYINGHLTDEGLSFVDFNGLWRIREELTAGGTEYTLASGTFVVAYSPPQTLSGEGGAPIELPEMWAVVFDGLPGGLLPANNSAQSDIRLEISRASGANEITAPGLSGSIAVTWTP